MSADRRPRRLRRLRPVLARARAEENGNAAVEFIGWSAAVLVPVVYLIVALAQVQAASFAVASAADAASRVLEVETGSAASAHARAAASLAMTDEHLAPSAGTTAVSCRDSGCTASVVRVTAAVDLPVISSLGIGKGAVEVHAERTVTLAGGSR